MPHSCLLNKTIQQALSQPIVNKPAFWCVLSGNINEQEADPLREDIRCSMCSYVCKDVKGMNWHLFKDHQMKQPLRKQIATTVCLACSTEFHSRTRVLRHISRSSPRCRLFYGSIGDIDVVLCKELDDEELIISKARDRMQRMDVQSRFLCRMLDDCYRTGKWRENDRPRTERCHRVSCELCEHFMCVLIHKHNHHIIMCIFFA